MRVTLPGRRGGGVAPRRGDRMTAGSAARWAVLAVVLVAGCRPSEGGGEGPGGRRQPLGLSPEEELEVGRRAHREVMAEYRGRVLPDGDPEVERVRRVAARLVKASEIEALRREI